jgi:hypothetical protein
MADKKAVELTPEEKDALIQKLQAQNADLEKQTVEQTGLIEELAAKSKLSIEVPHVEVDGKTYKIVVPTFFDGKDVVPTKDLPENILRGQIGEALIEA